MKKSPRGTVTRFYCQILLATAHCQPAKPGDCPRPHAAVRERLRAIEDLPLLEITPEVEPLASALLKARILPRKAATDAAHIALAAVHGMDLPVTWNCVHIANAVMAKAVAQVCEDHGFECPVLCTPEELLGE